MEPDKTEQTQVDSGTACGLITSSGECFSTPAPARGDEQPVTESNQEV